MDAQQAPQEKHVIVYKNSAFKVLVVARELESASACPASAPSLASAAEQPSRVNRDLTRSQYPHLNRLERYAVAEAATTCKLSLSLFLAARASFAEFSLVTSMLSWQSF